MENSRIRNTLFSLRFRLFKCLKQFISKRNCSICIVCQCVMYTTKCVLCWSVINHKPIFSWAKTYRDGGEGERRNITRHDKRSIKQKPKNQREKKKLYEIFQHLHQIFHMSSIQFDRTFISFTFFFVSHTRRLHCANNWRYSFWYLKHSVISCWISTFPVLVLLVLLFVPHYIDIDMFNFAPMVSNCHPQM